MRTPKGLEERAHSLLRRHSPSPVRDLITLIEDVNPTGRELAASVRERRYQLKSRLQSRLLRDFSADIDITMVPGDDNLVALRHRPLDADACHARISELDEDVRSAVRFRLDTATSSGLVQPQATPVSAPKKRSAAESASALQRGQVAMAEYDFDAARAAFTEAIETADDDLAAIALLELLVDQLAAWDDALAIEKHLGPEQTSARVRGLLATAAAQAGHADECERLALDSVDPRLGGAFLVLAQSSLASGDLTSAERFLARAVAHAAPRADLVPVEAALAELRTRSRQPEEDELQALAERGDATATALRARALLARWPDSVVARRLLKELEAGQRAASLAAVLTRANEAVARGDDGAALIAWSEAMALGASGLENAIAQAVGRQEQRLEAGQVAAVVSALKAQPGEGALVAYLDLETHLRARVRAEHPSRVVEWLEELADDGAKQRADAVAAVLALQSASLLTPDDARLGEVLLPHAERVARIPEGRRLWALHEDGARRRAEAAADHRLHEAEARLAAGAVEEAIAEAEKLVRVLQGVRLARAQHVLDEAARRLAAEQREARFVAAQNTGDLVEALHLAGEGELEGTSPLWGARRREVSKAIASAWRIQVSTSPENFNSPEWHATDSSGLQFALGPSGETFFWVSMHGPLLVVRQAEVSSGRVISVVALEPPVAFVFPDLLVDDDTVWVTGGVGVALQLTIGTWEVLRWVDARGRSSAEIIEDALVTPGGRWFWTALRPSVYEQEALRIFDTEHRRVVKETPNKSIMIASLARPGEPHIVASGYTRESRIFAGSGAQVATLPRNVEEVALAPNGRGLLAVHGDREERDDELPLEVLLISEDEPRRLDALVFPDAYVDTQRYLATSLLEQRSWLLHGTPEPGQKLASLQCRDDRITLDWNIGVPDGGFLITDKAAQRVALIVGGKHGPRGAVLGATAPEFEPYVTGTVPTQDAARLWCEPSTDRPTGELKRALDRIQSPADRRAAVAELVLRFGDDPALLLAAVQAWETKGWFEDAETLAQAALARCPTDVPLRLVAAGRAAGNFEAERAWALLQGLDGAYADGAERRHAEHLRAIVMHDLGQWEEARSAITLCTGGDDGGCLVTGWMDWLNAEQGVGDPNTPAARLLAAVVAADAALETGDHAAALAALDIGVVWKAMDAQAAARLAEAALANPPGLHPLRRRLLFAEFEARTRKGPEGTWRELPLRHRRWGEERIASVAARVRAADSDRPQ